MSSNNLQFFINRHDPHGAGIQQKPDVFPPEEEVLQQRYHYMRPKMMMPVSAFLHHLTRAQRNEWGEHPYDTWLQRLPKKLNESLEKSMENQLGEDLLFAWGVHIIDGPSHEALGYLLAVGITITFIISLIIFGAAKTQEQAFGIGSYLLAILACIMGALYFKETDQ